MEIAEPALDESTTDLARECLYRFLAAALGDPYAGAWNSLFDRQNQRLASEAASLLRADVAALSIKLGPGELSPTLLDCEPLLHELQRPVEELRAEYDRVFGLVVPRECPPYETEYHPTSETFFRSQQLADIAGFYRAFELEPAQNRPERPDHIALEMEFMAFVLMKKRLALDSCCDRPDCHESAGLTSSDLEHAKICEEAAHKFFCDHLAWWVPAFASGLRRKAAGGFYGAVANILAALISAERAWLGIAAATRPAQPELIERPEEQAGCAACPLTMASPNV
jgi:TorA maturation chaperone TorD